MNQQRRMESQTRRFSRSEMLWGLLRGVSAALLATVFIALVVPAHIAPGLLRLHLSLVGLAALAGTAYLTLSQQRRSELWEWSVSAYRALTTEQKLYLHMFLMLAFAALLTLTGNASWMQEIITLIFFFAGYVAIHDGYRWYRTLSENLLGKAAISLGFAIASALAYGLASQKVADVIHVTPTNFSRTNVLIAIMMIPVLITMAGAFLSAVGIVLSSLIMLPLMLPGFDKVRPWLFAGTWRETKLRFAFVTRIFQVMFYTFIGTSLYIFGRQGLTWYEDFISRQIPSLVYELDMYNALECELPVGSKLAPLGDGRFLIARRGPSHEITFLRPIRCDV